MTLRSPRKIQCKDQIIERDLQSNFNEMEWEDLSLKYMYSVGIENGIEEGKIQEWVNQGMKPP